MRLTTNWWLPICGALGAFILLAPTLTFGNDAGAFLLSILLAAVIGVTLMIVVIIELCKPQRQGKPVLAMICIFLSLSWLLFKSADYLRRSTRWMVYSRNYKAQVLHQSNSSDGTLKHIEWDDWGFPGAGYTTVYLVFDPNNGLADAARTGISGKLNGIPCQVVRVHRLESNWYTVLFYTDTDWNDCS